MKLVRHLPRPRTLRARLTFGLVVLLAVSCAAVGVAAVIELNGFLISRLDQQLTQAGDRFPQSLEHKGQPPDDHDGDEHGDTRRQTTGTFGARLVGTTVTNSDVVGPGSVTGVPLSARDRSSCSRSGPTARGTASISPGWTPTGSWPAGARTATC